MSCCDGAHSVGVAEERPAEAPSAASQRRMLSDGERPAVAMSEPRGWKATADVVAAWGFHTFIRRPVWESHIFNVRGSSVSSEPVAMMRPSLENAIVQHSS